MPSADDYTNVVKRYLDTVANGSADEICALYTDDATLEDPVGSEVRNGRAAIHDFYAPIENLGAETELVTVKVAGNEAAYVFRLTFTAGDSRTQVEPIGIMTFDDDAKITSMRAYWSPDDVRVLE